MFRSESFTRRRGPLGLVVALALLLYVGMPPGGYAATSSAGTATARYDGRTLYQGIFLGHGPVADLIPEVRDNLKLEYFIPEAKTRAELLAYYDEIFDGMEAIQPGFFDEFAQVIQSGDHVEIAKELDAAANLTVEALERTAEYQAAMERLGKDRSLVVEAVDEFNAQVPADQQISYADVDKVIDQISGGQTEAFALVWICATFVVAVVWVVAAVDVAVVSNVAAAISIYLAIGVEKYVAGPSKRAVEVGDVLHEQMVDSIATQLAN